MLRVILVVCLLGVLQIDAMTMMNGCNRELDMVVVIDASGSVQESWNDTIDFIENFLSLFEIGDNATRVGLIDFSEIANSITPLDSNNDVLKVVEHVEQLRGRPQNGQTNTDRALERAEEMFRGATPQRPKATQVLLVFTDGEVTTGNVTDLAEGVEQLDELAVVRFAIAVNNDTFEDGLEAIASKPSQSYIYRIGENSSGLFSQGWVPPLVPGVCYANIDNVMVPVVNYTGPQSGNKTENKEGSLQGGNGAVPEVGIDSDNDNQTEAATNQVYGAESAPKPGTGAQVPTNQVGTGGQGPTKSASTNQAGQGQAVTTQPGGNKAGSAQTAAGQSSVNQVNGGQGTAPNPNTSLNVLASPTSQGEHKEPTENLPSSNIGTATSEPISEKAQSTADASQTGQAQTAQTSQPKPSVALKPNTPVSEQKPITLPALINKPSNSNNSANAAETCDLVLVKIGCYNDRGLIPRPLPMLILEDRAGTHDESWGNALPSFICKCGKEARRRGFFTIGIQNFGQCYSGPDEGRYDEDGEAPSGNCVNAKLEPCTKDSLNCAGKENTNYVYTIRTPEHQFIHRIEYD